MRLKGSRFKNNPNYFDEVVFSKVCYSCEIGIFKLGLIVFTVFLIQLVK